jgi:GH24 family phage-related lysozyme (muramidase)
MNVKQLRLDLERDEGCVYAVYLDHLGYPTFGIGHLVTEADPEHGQPWELKLVKTEFGRRSTRTSSASLATATEPLMTLGLCLKVCSLSLPT